MAHYKRIFVF